MRPWRIAALVGLPVAMAAGAVALDRAYPPDLSRAQAVSAELRDASGRVLNLRTAPDGIVRLAPGATGDDIVPLLLSREDRRFWHEPAVDPLALLRAAGQLVRHGQVVSGGSTIAMQVARLLEPHPRSVWGKLHDIVRAVQLQADLGRGGVLRLYLTLAPMGGNIEGVRAAALLYFGREPAALSRAQAALLIGLPQSPARRRPDRYPEAAWRAARRVLLAAGDTSPLQAVPVSRSAVPGLARHLAQHLKGRSDTTLDGDLQAAVEALAQREVGWLDREADIAAMVVRNRDRAVLAYLGGTRFFEPAGMVDRVRAVRSPGSALKPFIYAMAFDQGLATPNTWLDDAPLRLGTYAPRDFDREEHGPRTAADALRQSLNRPAVRLLAEIGPIRFAATLHDAGAAPRLPPGGVPSAALALGGTGSTLADLAALYSDLADGGSVGVPHTGEPGWSGSGTLVSRRAAEAVAAILRDQPPPPGVVADPAHPIAYKTGTSYGFHDAWACGFTPDYTVVVWVGRRDGSSIPGATGRDVAAPLLFRLFSLLPAEPPLVNPDDRAKPLAPRLGGMTSHGALRIVFPPERVDLAYDPGTPIDLRATGGTPPYAWLSDGLPLPLAPAWGHADWTPAGPGFAHLTVTDRDGRSASVDVRLVAD
jgi:penicillin-binding protein 1C